MFLQEKLQILCICYDAEETSFCHMEFSRRTIKFLFFLFLKIKNLAPLGPVEFLDDLTTSHIWNLGLRYKILKKFYIRRENTNVEAAFMCDLHSKKERKIKLICIIIWWMCVFVSIICRVDERKSGWKHEKRKNTNYGVRYIDDIL